MAAFRLSELLVGLSLTIDIGGGAPLEKGLRTCAVATALADGLELDLPDRPAVSYAALLMGIGCTAHARRPRRHGLRRDAAGPRRRRPRGGGRAEGTLRH